MDEPTRDELLDMEADMQEACDNEEWELAFNVKKIPTNSNNNKYPTGLLLAIFPEHAVKYDINVWKSDDMVLFLHVSKLNLLLL